MTMLTWKRSKVDMMPIYKAEDKYSKYVIRSWPYIESGGGGFQLCIDGFHEGWILSGDREKSLVTKALKARKLKENY